ncbi:MAG: hypothetical protein ACRDN6_01845 [Gaiellaceae bacterium]
MILVAAIATFFCFSAAASARLSQVVPFRFDPYGSNLVESSWINHIGCPTGATVYAFDGTPSPYTDAGCPTRGATDRNVQGLLLAKTGPTTNFASAGAELKGVAGEDLVDLGYDIRKFGGFASPFGSHCGAGAPRFNVTTNFGTHFIGCASPPPLQVAAGPGWTRLRWTPAQAFPPIPPGADVQQILIIFDEGQDASGGPDQFGLAVLDNIAVNGTIVGQRPPSS